MPGTARKGVDNKIVQRQKAHGAGGKALSGQNWKMTGITNHHDGKTAYRHAVVHLVMNSGYASDRSKAKPSPVQPWKMLARREMSSQHARH